MSTVTLEPFQHKNTGQIKFKLGVDGASRQLILNTHELAALQTLIQRVQEDSRVTAPTT